MEDFSKAEMAHSLIQTAIDKFGESDMTLADLTTLRSEINKIKEMHPTVEFDTTELDEGYKSMLAQSEVRPVAVEAEVEGDSVELESLEMVYMDGDGNFVGTDDTDSDDDDDLEEDSEEGDDDLDEDEDAL